MLVQHGNDLFLECLKVLLRKTRDLYAKLPTFLNGKLVVQYSIRVSFGGRSCV